MSSAKTTISVLMCVYNAEEFVQESVDSILAQTHADFEFVIVNDGSTDESGRILDDLSQRDRRIHLIHTSNQGPSAARSLCLEKATGDICFVFDADDVACPDRIACQVDYLECNPGTAAVGSAVEFIGRSGQSIDIATFPQSASEIRSMLERGTNALAHPTVAFRRQAALQVGGYRTAFGLAEDYDLWLRLSERHELANVSNVLVRYRIHRESVSQQHRAQQILVTKIACLAARHRRNKRYDPTEGLKDLSIEDLKRFQLSGSERHSILSDVAEACEASYRASNKLDDLEASVAAFRQIHPTAESRKRILTRRLVQHLASRGSYGQSTKLATSYILKDLVGSSVASSHRSVLRFRRGAGGYREVGRWLARYSDPLGAHRPGLGSTLDPQFYQVLINEAALHGTLATLIRNLPEATVSGEFDKIRHLAEQQVLTLRSLSVMLRLHGQELMGALQRSDVALIKGATFARKLYPDPTLRSFTDIDLLVRESAVPDVERILLDQGFQMAWQDKDRQEAKWIHSSNSSLLVELHTNMVHHPGLRNVMSLTLDDFDGQIETPGAQLAIAAIHGALHQFQRLQHVVDICQASRSLNSSEDEALFERILLRSGGRLAAISGLELAGRLFSEPRCFQVARALGPERFSVLSRQLITPDVVVSMQGKRRRIYSWRCQAFRYLLKSPGKADAGTENARCS